jgi:GNAT superfamily N-acetyltransferase
MRNQERHIIFKTDKHICVELTETDIPQLQRFYAANPEYFQITEGRGPLPNEAELEMADRPPEDMSYTKVWILGFLDESGGIVGMAEVCSNLMAAQVWHIGLFMIATRCFGAGIAYSLYQALEGWIKSEGAKWLRLGVVKGNGRAERFWEKLGFIETRSRDKVEMGDLVNTVRYLFKPLSGGSITDYLELVERDRP